MDKRCRWKVGRYRRRCELDAGHRGQHTTRTTKKIDAEAVLAGLLALADSVTHPRASEIDHAKVVREAIDAARATPNPEMSRDTGRTE